jgi:hypothetical protein
VETKNYTSTTYTVDIELPKPPHIVFAHLIDLRKWWPEDFEGEDVKLGSEFIFTLGDSHYSKNKVIEFVPNEKLAWVTLESIRASDRFDWTGTKMIFEITPKASSTHLSFTYDGVVLENESERLIQICDLCIKEMFYNYVVDGKNK